MDLERPDFRRCEDQGTPIELNTKLITRSAANDQAVALIVQRRAEMMIRDVEKRSKWYRDRLFGLRVTGESMIGAGINDGDVIIAKEDHTAEVGDIVIAMVEDEATVKYFHLGDNQVELRPANPTMESQFYAYDQVGIQGKVVALYRTY